MAVSRQLQEVEELLDMPLYPTVEQLLRAHDSQDAYRWFVHHSKVFRDVDLITSKKLIDRYRCIPKHCYQNCFHADITGEHYYYEGYVIAKESPYIAMAHSWLVKKDNYQVIDVTLPTVNHSGAAYIGVEIPRDIVNKLAFKLEVTGDFLYHVYAEQNIKAHTSIGGRQR